MKNENFTFEWNIVEYDLRVTTSGYTSSWKSMNLSKKILKK